MQDRFMQRLERLRQEFDLGQQRLRELDLERRETEHTLLRISGAIQVLEELLGSQQGQPDDATRPETAPVEG